MNILLTIIVDNEVSRGIKDVDLLNYVEMDPQISFFLDIMGTALINDLNFENPFLGSCQN
jgi:hypothetical protein